MDLADVIAPECDITYVELYLDKEPEPVHLVGARMWSHGKGKKIVAVSIGGEYFVISRYEIVSGYGARSLHVRAEERHLRGPGANRSAAVEALEWINSIK